MNTINLKHPGFRQALRLLCLLLLLEVSQDGFGQESERPPFWNTQMETIAKPNSKKGWVEFRDNLAIDARHLFKDHREAFGLTPHDEMQLQKVQTDASQFKHYRFEQYHRGVRIAGAGYMVHEDPSGQVVSANGKIAETLNVRVQPRLTEPEALRAALKYVDASAGLWNQPDQVQGDSTIEADSYYPQGSLILCKKNPEEGLLSANLVLAWTFDLIMDASAISTCIVIDAATGTLVDQYPLEMHCDPGTVATPWYGTQNLNADLQIHNGHLSYVLLDNCTGTHSFTIHTYIENGNGLEEVRSSNNTWNANASEIAAGTTHWSVHQAMDYFRTVHGRDSWDDNNANIIAYIEPGFGNAQWTGANRLRFGAGDSNLQNDLNTVDIVGHEFTHAVTETSAGLLYRRQSGALNESFSDIFGELVERYTRGHNDWLVGGDRGALRNMSHRRAYRDHLWIETEACTPTGPNDHCGVHTNSGVQNYWFYLLSDGGSGTNHFGEQYAVDGIGLESAGAIAYLALTGYMGSEDNYLDAREATLRAARQLFGACSNEEVQVGKAWYAVHVGNELTRFNREVCGDQNDGYFQGINSVTSGGAGCSTTVSATANPVTFAAGNYISLLPGFRAVVGGANRFLAYIQACSFTVYQLSGASANREEKGEAGDRIMEESGTDNLAVTAPTLTIAPNPVNTSATIQFSVPEASPVSVDIYDLNGRRVQQVYTETSASGQYQLQFDGSSLLPGIYLCRLSNGVATTYVRMVIAR